MDGWMDEYRFRSAGEVTTLRNLIAYATPRIELEDWICDGHSFLKQSYRVWWRGNQARVV